MHPALTATEPVVLHWPVNLSQHQSDLWWLKAPSVPSVRTMSCHCHFRHHHYYYHHHHHYSHYCRYLLFDCLHRLDSPSGVRRCGDKRRRFMLGIEAWGYGRVCEREREKVRERKIGRDHCCSSRFHLCLLRHCILIEYLTVNLTKLASFFKLDHNSFDSTRTLTTKTKYANVFCLSNQTPNDPPVN